MRALLMVLVTLLTSVAGANEELHFIDVPQNVAVSEAVDAVTKAAMRRKWEVVDAGTDTLKIKLDHKNYRVLLELLFSKDKVTYKDHTTYFDKWAADRFGSASVDAQGPSPKPVPVKWLNNLRRDTRAFLANIQSAPAETRQVSEEDVVSKLEKLKGLRDKGLISEAEYKAKKAQILSAY